VALESHGIPLIRDRNRMRGSLNEHVSVSLGGREARVPAAQIPPNHSLPSSWSPLTLLGRKLISDRYFTLL
jgi:hypothetical protein